MENKINDNDSRFSTENLLLNIKTEDVCKRSKYVVKRSSIMLNWFLHDKKKPGCFEQYYKSSFKSDSFI